jgi:hypothetical protein
MRRLLAAALVVFWPVGADAAQLVAFEALYEASVQNWKMPGDVDDVSGTQIVRLEKTCTEWKLAAQFNLKASTGGGPAIDFETDLSGTESLDGLRYRFRSDTRMRGQSLTQIEGEARRPAAGQAGRVTLTQPEAKTLALPHDALFPVAASMWTTQQWERGQKTANYVMFDGTTPDPVRVFELITGPPARLDPPPDGDVALLSGPGWRTTGSFHRYSGQEAEPLSTLTQSVYGNGVASELAVDVGIADVVLRLRRVRALPAPKC